MIAEVPGPIWADAPQWTTSTDPPVEIGAVEGSPEYLFSGIRGVVELSDGRLVVIGLMGGRTAEVDLGMLLTRRLQIIGSTLRALSSDRKGEILSSLMTEFGEQIANGAVRPVIDRVLPFSRADEAHRVMAEGGAFGKIVLTPDDEAAPSAR